MEKWEKGFGTLLSRPWDCSLKGNPLFLTSSALPLRSLYVSFCWAAEFTGICLEQMKPPQSRQLSLLLPAKHWIFLLLHSKRYFRSTCFVPLKGSHHSSRGLSNSYIAITTVSTGQMSLRIKSCCSITYFSNLAAWWTHSSWAAAVMSFPSTWHWKSKR